MEKLVSIIVPVHKYLDHFIRCLDSLSVQTYKNYEVIIVCSKRSLKDVEILSNKYYMKTKIILATEGDGPSFYRNLGIDESSGEYIVFVDSDDNVEENYLSKLVEGMRDGSLLSICNYNAVDFNNHYLYKSDINSKEHTVLDCLSHIFGVNEKQYNGFVWNKMFVAKQIKDNDIRFDERISLNEDRLFVVDYLLSLNEQDKVSYTPDELIHYLRHGESITYRLEMGTLEKHKAASEILAFYECEKKLTDYKWIRESLADESVERSIRLLRTFEKRTDDSKKIASYLKKIRKKYRYLFTAKRKLQIFIYEKYILRTIYLKLKRKNY